MLACKRFRYIYIVYHWFLESKRFHLQITRPIEVTAVVGFLIFRRLTPWITLNSVFFKFANAKQQIVLRSVQVSLHKRNSIRGHACRLVVRGRRLQSIQTSALSNTVILQKIVESSDSTNLSSYKYHWQPSHL